MKFKTFLFLLPALLYECFAFSQTAPIEITKTGQLIFHQTEKGDRVPDFSYCGYRASELPIPNIPVKVIVPHQAGDATANIQQALDFVGELPADQDGFRGAVLLEKGNFQVTGQLLMRRSGVVLRGSGNRETTLTATGLDRETLIRIAGQGRRRIVDSMALSNRYFPVNSTVFTFDSPHPFQVGDQVLVHRPSTADWISALGTDKIGLQVDYQLTHWQPGDFDLNWDRTVAAVTANSITVDAPITTAIDPEFGGGQVLKYHWPERIENIGVENLNLVSTYNPANLKDENHRWMAITVDNATDVWVRRVRARNFVSSAVAVWETARRVTVEDCKSLEPIGETGNFRRYAFHSLGQQVLFQRCYSEYAYHAFSTGFTAPGPTAFVQCYAYLPIQFSGAIGGWSSGVLFDKATVVGGNLSFGYRDVDAQGAGWAAANSLLWQCRAAKIYLDKPPTAQNWAYGSWAQGYGSGDHQLATEFLKPESIFYAQLEQRLGRPSIEEDKIWVYTTSRTSAPQPEYAVEMGQHALSSDLTMDNWIDSMIAKYPLENRIAQARRLPDLKLKKTTPTPPISRPIALQNGLLTCQSHLITGRLNRTSLWRGSTRPSYVNNPPPNIVRYVPGRVGRGLTDDLDTLVADMAANHVFGMMQFPGLWYERRRDDHARTMRADADVWTPFLEQPFSRSGQGEAYDRLSKYDLNQWNYWYWNRLKTFADLADQCGLLLVQEHYLQHNIIEEGAHWADYPWRSANNINDLGFAEPTAYAGDKRVYMAEAFYDVENAVRRAYHRKYIRKNLDNFSTNANIIHHLGLEYTGPLHFAQFWLDVISEWEQENHRDVLVMLPGTRDVQEAILADPKRAAVVDIIDVLQWQYRSDSSLYAPPGGVNLAARQYARIMEPGQSSPEQVYRAVRELRTRYPDKAVVYSRRSGPGGSWAEFMAGGSFAGIPPVADAAFLEQAALMKPIDLDDPTAKQWTLGKKGLGYIAYAEGGSVSFDLSGETGSFFVKRIDPATGAIIVDPQKVDGGKLVLLENPGGGVGVVWLTR
ncbi:MAG: hypothetical protein KDD14_05315 [Saprospiraceae bacterium]|nr:hypothetical protein [Saprospiraceae bacterium]